MIRCSRWSPCPSPRCAGSTTTATGGSPSPRFPRTSPSCSAEHDERVEPGELSTAPAGPGAKHVLALNKTRFPASPRALRLETDLFGTAAGEGHLEALGVERVRVGIGLVITLVIALMIRGRKPKWAYETPSTWRGA